MQIRADFLALGGGGIFRVERTDGMFPGLLVRASEPTEPLLLFVIGKVDRAEIQRTSPSRLNAIRQLIQSDSPVTRPLP